VAIYHFSAKVIGRSAGRSVVASAAYRAAERLHDDKLDRDHDYTEKAGVVHREIMLPADAPARWLDRGTLWNEVEAGEKRKDAQLARDIEISLPRELGQAEAIRLARDFVQEQFVSRGMVADLNVHWTVASDGALQPHAHVMLTMREVLPGPDGHPEDGAFGKKVVAWNDRGLLCGWRERWAEMANARLCELDHDVRIDHRSFRDQGIDLEPQHKIGPAGARREQRGENAERAAEHRAISRRNGEALLAEPDAALRMLTQQHSTFTRADMARLVNRHTDGAEQFAAAMAKVTASRELTWVGLDGRGRERFSTREMLAAEQRMERAAATIAEGDAHRVLPAAGRQALAAAEQSGLVFGDEQRDAFQHVTSGRDLALVVGYAGTGKSAMLGVARTAWEAAGFRVRGAALSGIAAEGLEAGSGIESRTLASLEYGWKEGRDLLTSRDVLVVDEAGMVGSRQMERVLSAAAGAGAKVVLVGDPEQLQAIEAGAAFRALAERHGAAEISQVRRQREAWQCEATRELATERTGAALGRYERAGMVQGADTREAACAALVGAWDAERRQSPEQSRVILAYTRADVAELNRLARERLRAAGELGVEHQAATERGERAFAARDRVMFLRNERGLGAGPDGRGVAVKNGTLGTVLAVDGGAERLTVRLDGAGSDGPVVTFSVRDYGHVEHGYAATVHKAQGVTVDRAHVLASRFMDRHAAYVALTRHREGVSLHYGRDEFRDGAALARALGRERLKDTSLDYDGPDGAAREGEALARRYAERRGLDPLRPESAIVARPEPETSAVAEPERVGPKRGRFAGLRLGMGQGASRLVPVRLPELAPEPQPEPARPEAQGERLQRGLAGFARAWADAGRMGRAGLPVLPHQEAALARAGEALEREGAGLARDAAVALERSPALAGLAAGGQAGKVALFGRAVEEERREREALEERGRAAARAWDKLERAHDAAAGRFEWDAARAATKELEAFAQALKRDTALEGVLRERGPELGVAAGSRLARVAAMSGAVAERELARELRLEQAPRQSPGMSLGM